MKAIKNLFNIIFLSLLLLTTARVEAQSSDTLISGSFVDEPLPNVLSSVKKMYLYKFAYDATTLKEYRVTDSFDNLPIDDFLEELFKNIK